MAESPSHSESESPSYLGPILDLLLSVGYTEAQKTDISAPDKLAGGLSWCIAAVNDVVRYGTLARREEIDVEKGIEEGLRLIGCPHLLEASQIETLDCKAIFPVVQWLVNRIRTIQDHRGDDENMEREESEFQSNCSVKRSELQTDVIELEGRIANGCDSNSISDILNHPFIESLERLNSAKKELAARCREILAVKRQLDDVPSQSELIQYDRRFSELYVHIQEKHRQTRKYYGTYNALLEIKELMLKEISLLNSISSQFQDAITSTAGRTKLIESMEGIVKSIQQKQGKVQLGLQEEQKVCDALKQRYAAAVAEQRRCYTLLKAFQEECAKNEKLRCQGSI